MKYIYITFIFFVFYRVEAQVGGEYVYEFLNISTSARQLGLGGETLTLRGDINQPEWNPSTINSILDNQLGVNYSNYLSGISIGSISYAHLINRRFGTLYFNAKYSTYGNLIEADELGIETGTFTASDASLSIGYARSLPLRNFYIGVNIKFISSSIASYSSTGVATDIGISYYTPYVPYSFGLVVRNIGTQLKPFSGVKESLPLQITLGGSYKLEHIPLQLYATLTNLQRWNVSVSNPSNQTVNLDGSVIKEKISFIDNLFRHVVIGAEFFPESDINLRVGYNFRRAKELQRQNIRTFGGISFGFGIKMKKLKFNYSYSKIHSATNVSTFSLEIDLNSPKNY